MKQTNNFKQTEIGEIPEDWQVDRLKNHVSIKGRIGWKGLKKSEYLDSGYAIINGLQFRDGSIDWTSVGRISKIRFDESPEIKLKQNDILMTKDGTIGKLAYLKNLPEEATVASGVFVIRNDSELLSQTFLYHYFHTPNFKSLVRSRIEGAVIPHLYQRDINELLVPLPSIDEQQKIASILSSLDDKIELNRRMNKTLEEIGKALFKRWFVDFEFPNENGKPYKSSGGGMVDSELGEIPKGWRASRVREIATLKSGFAFKGSAFKGSGKYGVIKIKNIIDPDVDVMDIQFVSDEVANDRARQFILNSGDILIAMSGNTTGKIGILVKGDYELVLNQRVGKYFLKNTNYHWYLYFLLRSGDIQKSIVEKAYGSAQPNISPSLLEDITLIIPDNNVLEKFNEISSHLMKSYIKNYTENMKLTNLRDSLLPRLISGKIRVN